MRNSKEYAERLLADIKREKREVSLMEVCGTHTVAIARSGLRSLVPPNLKLLSGPGCPVCVTAQSDIDAVIELARRPGVILVTFGDMMRVPGSESSLQEEKARGADVRVVYSPSDALEIARQNPERETVFLGIGFETTAPAVALTIEQAAASGLANFSVWSLHKLVGPALDAVFSDESVKVDGLICPGHVSAVTGVKPYEPVVSRYHKPCVITGFETLDILEGIWLLLRQLNQGVAEIEIQYRRIVRPEGNPLAQAAIERVFTATDASWRGLGIIPASGLAIREEYGAWDAQRRFDIPEGKERIIKGCRCGDVLRGVITPYECPLFGQACTPVKPVGPCMVSQEGACAAYYRYGRSHRL
ncbi:MAG TPA: hydrogenase formation protein HypD [Syntrophothermus lipocalidus]|uniref:Hydrogenase expression/formation protein HypD n=1 Tax=Syntrophothermus lipocalidus (strain DSM 12680 / TGB-C1) TaxID=643648 RepID=D7CKE0_SYNLT|nr:hydrogenase formation protein HypD [Syntrophothermus lipocalidus]ADI01175.1 hydrogenase expression/formation protein HypD [Syntrophothermus lipocalidus DSM 12680]HHV77899.1 hydrogenase formation protein HypD [Syntrophothermus lipocalidus]